MGYEPAYNPEEDKEAYSIEFIYDTLKYFGLEQYMPDFIDVVVFDCIIGNQDRHQENWGFITPIETKSKILSHDNTQVKDSWRGSKVAPIYDSGSSLGRERTEETIINMLRDPLQFEAYINRYKPEPENEQDKYAIALYKSEQKIGYVKKVHNMVFHKTSHPIKVEVISTEANGHLNSAYIRIYL